MRSGRRMVAGRFEIERSAGAGGMGAVYKALDHATGANVALKMLLAGGTEGADRFEREGRVLAELSHSVIVRYVAHGTTPEGEPYLAMEWLEGEDLQRRLARGPLTLGETLTLGRRLSGALGTAHALGVVHRDMKPSNVFLESGAIERAKLLDFGIARFGATRFTASGVGIGTPGYMAPEQISGERAVEPAADVFALGCVLFECLVGRPVFGGDQLMAVLAKILFEPAPRVSAFATVPAWFDELVARMLEKRAEDRPEDGATVEAILVRAEKSSTAPPAQARMEGGENLLSSVVFATRAADGGAPTMAESDPLPTARPPVAMVVEGRGVVDATLRARIEGRGGSIEGLPDGSLVVAIQAGDAATDRAVAAARCALVLREWVPDARVAVATARTARAPGVSDSPRTLSEAIDRAAALLRGRAAEEGVVRLDVVTAGLLDARFDVVMTPGGAVLRAEHAAVDRARGLLGKPTPCVGRERELAQLTGHLEDATAEERAVAVLVTAPPGVGKSRLRSEFSHRTRRMSFPTQVALGRGDPLHAASPFALLGALVGAAVGVSAGAGVLERRHRLEKALSNVAGGTSFAFLSDLLGAPLDPGADELLDAARRDAKLFGASLRRAVQALLRAITETRSLVLVIEDVQWADTASLELLDDALRAVRDRPWMLLGFGRPGSRERHATLFQGEFAHEIRLSELGRRPSEALVREVLGASVDGPTVTRIVERAAGNAFYLEELIRAVSEHVRDNGPDAAAAWAGTALPETVLAMVESRLSRVPVEGRRVLQAASVLGERFFHGGVVELLGGVDPATLVDTWLARLCAEEVVLPVAESRFAGEREYAFRHALLRDGAYATLPAGDRAVGHRLAGAWLVAAGERDAAVVAEHFERGDDPASAISFSVEAAAQALSRNDFAQAIARCDRAEALGATGPLLLRARLVRGRARFYLARWAAARSDFEAALPAIDANDVEMLAEVHGALTGLCHWLTDAPGIATHSKLAVSYGQRAGREDVRMLAAATASFQCRTLEEALPVVRGLGAVGKANLVEVAMASHVFAASAAFPEGLDFAERCLSAAKRADDGPTRGFLLQTLAICLAGLGRFGEAEQAIDEARHLTRQHALWPVLARATCIGAGLAFERFDFALADERATEALEAGRTAGFAPTVLMALVDRSRCAVRLGDTARATSHLPEARAVLASLEGLHAAIARVRMLTAEAELLVARGELGRAEVAARDAIAAAVFVARPKYEIFARVALASALASAGKPAPAIEELRAAVDLAQRRMAPGLLLHAAAPLVQLTGDPEILARASTAAATVAASLEGEARERFQRAVAWAVRAT